MATAFDYTKGKKITITNILKESENIACDAGTPVQKVQMKYDDVKDKPCIKFDYIFKEDGSLDTDNVIVYKKVKTLDRLVPAYRTFNAKLLKPGDSVVFTTTNKDEIVFFEKVQDAFKGELEVKFDNVE